MRIMKLCMGEDGQADFTKSWTSSRQYGDSTVEQINDANLRELYDDEIILDSESKLHAHKVRKQLIKNNVPYKRYDTGSRGEHFHIRVNELQKENPRIRIQYRAEFIKKYDCDLAKKNGFIAMEDRPHLKTGKHKRLIEIKEGKLELDQKLLSKIQTIYSKLYNKNTQSLNSSSDTSSLKQKIKPSDILSKWGIDITKTRTDTPFGVSKSKACLAYNDKKGVFYDFNQDRGGDIFTMVQMKHGCSFLEAKEMLENGKY